MKFAVWTVLLTTLTVGGAYAGMLDAENALKAPAPTTAAQATAAPTPAPATSAAYTPDAATTPATASTAKPGEDAMAQADANKQLSADELAKKKEEDKETCVAPQPAPTTAGAQELPKTEADKAEAQKPTCSKVDYSLNNPTGDDKAAESRPELPDNKANIVQLEGGELITADNRSYDNFGGQQPGAVDDTAGDGTTTMTSLAEQNAKLTLASTNATDDGYILHPELKKEQAIPHAPLTTQTPQVTTNGTATARLQAGQWPTNVQDLVTLAVAYMRERGYSEAVIQEVVMTINRESGWNYLAKADSTSASGLGQYIDGTWRTSAARCWVDAASGRWSPIAQIEVLACDKNQLYQKYAAGTLDCGGTNISFNACSYVYHYAGSWDRNRPDRIQYALNYFNKTYQGGANQYAQAASTLGGGDVNSILAGMPVSQVTGLGSQVPNQYSTPMSYQQNLATQFPGVYTNPSSFPNSSNSPYSQYSGNPNGQYTGSASTTNGYNGSGSTSSKDADKEERKALKKELRQWAKLCDVDMPNTKKKSIEVLEARLTLMIKRCKV